MKKRIIVGIVSLIVICGVGSFSYHEYVQAEEKAVENTLNDYKEQTIATLNKNEVLEKSNKYSEVINSFKTINSEVKVLEKNKYNSESTRSEEKALAYRTEYLFNMASCNKEFVKIIDEASKFNRSVTQSQITLLMNEVETLKNSENYKKSIEMANEEEGSEYLTNEDIKCANAMSVEINKLNDILPIMSRFETLAEMFKNQ